MCNIILYMYCIYCFYLGVLGVYVYSINKGAYTDAFCCGGFRGVFARNSPQGF